MGKNQNGGNDQQSKQPTITVIEPAKSGSPQNTADTQKQVEKEIELPMANKVTNPNIGPTEGVAGPGNLQDAMQRQQEQADQKVRDDQAEIDRQKANVEATTTQVKEQQEERTQQIQELAKNQGDSDSAKEGDVRVVDGTEVTYHVGNTDEPSAG